MADDGDYAAPPARLMNFVSQEELDRAKKTRGERVEDGTAQRDRPLYESRKEYECQVANEEAEELQSFRKAVAAQSSVVRELKEVHTLPKPEESKPSEKKNSHARPLGGLIISVKPQAKKAKMEITSKQSPDARFDGHVEEKPPDAPKGALGTLVSYSDESEDD